MARVRLTGTTTRRVFEDAATYAEGPLTDPSRLTTRMRRLFSCHDPAELAPEPVGEGPGRYDAYSPWRGQPWLTPVIGSGPLGLPRTFLAVADNVDQLVLERLVKDNSSGWQACDEMTGADPRIWVPRYVDDLVASRVGRQSLTKTDGTAAPTGDHDETELRLASLLILVSAQITRTFHRISLDTTRVLGRWGSEYAEMAGGLDEDGEYQDHDRLNDLVREFIRPLGEACTSASKALGSSAKRAEPLDPSRAAMDKALVRLLGQLEHEISAYRPRITILRLQQITEAAWLYLVRAIAGDAYPGWTDLLLRLVLTEQPPEERGHTRPRWGEMAELAESVAGIMRGASDSRRSFVSADQRDSDRFYDAIAEVLWAQQEAKDDFTRVSDPANSAGVGPLRVLGALSQPVAFVTSFDCELEEALQRVARRLRLTRPDVERARSFSVLIPAFAKTGDEGEFVWLEAEIGTDEGRSLTDPTDWKLLGRHRSPQTWTQHPVVVHLMGCPLIPLPGLADPSGSLLAADLRKNRIEGRRELVHAITLDEYLALRQGDIEWQWSQDTEANPGLPREWFTTDMHGARRFWMLMGVPFQDPAVRARTLSVLTRPENAPKATSAGPGARPAEPQSDAPVPERAPATSGAPEDEVRQDTGTGLMDDDEDSATGPTHVGTPPAAATPEAPGSAQNQASARPGDWSVGAVPTVHESADMAPTRELVRGVAVGTRIDDGEAKLLNDLGLDVVTDRAEVFSTSLSAHAEAIGRATRAVRRKVSSRSTAHSEGGIQ